MVVSRIPDVDKPQREMTEEDIETVVKVDRRPVFAPEKSVLTPCNSMAHTVFCSVSSCLPSSITAPTSGEAALKTADASTWKLSTASVRTVGPDYPLMIKYGQDDRGDGLAARAKAWRPP